MWSDNETNRDFLNFRYVADTAAEMIVQANGRPLSVGVSGGWGAGKSSMMKLIADALRERATASDKKFLFVEFNAWLYQGYDDARAALMDVIARHLVKHAEETKTAVSKAKDFFGRVNWLRLAGTVGGSALAMSMGLPPTGIVGDVVDTVGDFGDGDVDSDDVDEAGDTAKKVGKEAKGLLRPKKERKSPPTEIHNLRKHFQDTLDEMKVTLVVLIDDLDRCLPRTAIATLEAMRLFLFMDRTAFVVAADDRMIRESVRIHFKDVRLDDELVTNYFDKLIQVPIRVPPLGTQDVRAYLMLLFIENSGLEQAARDELRKKICEQLAQSWQGKRVDSSFVKTLIAECPDVLTGQLDLADRLAPLMTQAKQIAGNPRLIKRFLNTLAIRMALAKSQHVSVDEAALAKMVLFERCGQETAYATLVKSINEAENGNPAFLASWEKLAIAGQPIPDLPAEWNTDFVRDWIGLPPAFAEMDLRAVVYVSREHMPIITAADRLSSEAAGLLAALLELKTPTTALTDRLRRISRRELSQIMDRLLDRARRVQEWGAPPILHACLAVIAVEPSLAEKLVSHMQTISGPQLRAPIVPLLADKGWAQALLNRWQSDPQTPGPVKKALEASLQKKAQ